MYPRRQNAACLVDTPLICPNCRAPLEFSSTSVACVGCKRSYPRLGGTIDFAPGCHYDSFSPGDRLTEAHVSGLELELDGSRRRIEDFYLPHIRSHAPGAKRVLDSGCGNGVSVETLTRHGYDAWGNDLSELRAWQWQQTTAADRLVLASSMSLPFPDRYFDVVISSGVIEHIGVTESSTPSYSVRPLPERDALRIAFMRELARVLRPGGSLYVDCPNGAFPLDFWHSAVPGRPRLHWTSEQFLPHFRELREAAREALPGCTVSPLSPHRRLQFRQAGRHVYGVLAPAADFLFRIMTWKWMQWLAATPVNPFLVARIDKPLRTAG